MDDETETRQSRRQSAHFEEEDASSLTLRRKSQLIFDKSTLLFQGPVVNVRGKNIWILPDDKQVIKKPRCLTAMLQELSRNINDPSTKTEIDTLALKAKCVLNCVTKAFRVTGIDFLEETKISKVIPSRVDIKRLSQKLTAFKDDLRVCTKEILSMKSSIHDVVDLKNQADDLRRKSNEYKAKGWFWTSTSVTLGTMFAVYRFGTSVAAGLMLAGFGMSVMNFRAAKDCERTAQDMELAPRKLGNSKAKIDHLTCDVLASLDGLLTECILGFERVIDIAQDFEDEVHRTVLQGDSFQIMKDVFQKYPEELKRKWVRLERMFLFNIDDYLLL